MIGVCKRVTLALVIVLMVGALQPAISAEIKVSCNPSTCTANSIFNILVQVKLGDGEVMDRVELYGTGSTIILYDHWWADADPEADPPVAGPPGTWMEPNPWKYLSRSSADFADGFIAFRVAVSAGLNMSNPLQQPKAQLVANGLAEEDWNTVPDDDKNPLLILDPGMNGVWYASNFVNPGPGITSPQICASVSLLPTEEGGDAPAGATTCNAPLTVPIVPAAGSQYDDPDNPFDDTVSWGSGRAGENSFTWGGGADDLEIYTGLHWPEIFYGPNPLTVVGPSLAITPNSTRPNDGSSSDTFEFRVNYSNWADLSPIPWLRSDGFGEADDFSTYAGATGVVLYLDYMNIWDPLDELYPFPDANGERKRGYRAHFMQPDDTPGAQSGDYLYRLQPMTIFRQYGATDHPTPAFSNMYMSFLMGNFHYFFACSDDSLWFIEPGLSPTLAFENNYTYWASQVGEENPDALANAERWGYDTESRGRYYGERAGNVLDPSTPLSTDITGGVEGMSRFQFVPDATGAPTATPYMPRIAGRTYSTYSIEDVLPRDYQLYVDRMNRVPGRFEPTFTSSNNPWPWYPHPYDYPSTEHPEITVALQPMDMKDQDGRGWFWGTLKPYYRAVNPTVQIDWGRNGLGHWASRMETSGATLDTTLTFRIRYFQRDNQPPRAIRLYVNNNALQIIEATAPCALDSATDVFTVTYAHGLYNGDIVYVTSSSNEYPAGYVPDPLMRPTLAYYVINKTDTTFQLSLTPGGPAVDFASNGNNLTFRKGGVTPETGGYVGYPMQPATIKNDGSVQSPPYNYTAGVEYVCRLSGRQLGAGPHTYYFYADDGNARAIFPARPNTWERPNESTITDAYIANYQPGGEAVLQNATGDDVSAALVGLDNNYCPGPYINNPCQLTSPSVTPATGIQGQRYVFRVKYTDIDGPNDLIPGFTLDTYADPKGQRPYQAWIYIDTGTTQDVGYGPGIVKANMTKEDPLDIDYRDGVWYNLDSASLDQFTLAQGVRRYRFEFIDDWGRAMEPNDRIRGEVTQYPSSGAWVQGPIISDNPRPTLRNGKIESTDGTANSATIYKASVKYTSVRNISPKYVTVYIGERQTDGETIIWDAGHDMVKADPGDLTYNDGCDYVFLTQLMGNDALTPSALSTKSSLRSTAISTSSVGLDVLNPVLPNGNAAYVSDRAIVRLKTPPVGVDPVQYRDNALSVLGVTLIRPLKLANTYLVKIGSASTVRDTVVKSRTIGSIRNATPDYRCYPSAIPNDPEWDKLWGLRMINAPQVWDTQIAGEFIRGKNTVTVAVLDTGVSPTHPDLQGRLLTGRDTADGDDDPSPDFDDSGHGTHVAGTIAAQGNNSIGVVGVCWDGVKILPVKVEAGDGSGMSFSAIIDGLDYARTQGAQVVNMSLGGPIGTAEFRDKISELAMSGIIVCVAAGNDGIANVSFPAAYDDCIAVSAVNQDEAITFYSNYGPEIDIAAPGGEDFDGFPGTDSQIWSTWWDGSDTYESIQGTSMACPHVAGAAALLLSTYSNPSSLLSMTDAKNKLLWGARVPASGVLVPIAHGYGILDVYGSLTATEPDDPVIPDPVDLGTYYYAFEASDGTNRATYVPATDLTPSLRSESAGCTVQETLTTEDSVVYQSSLFPIVGTLGAAPVTSDALIDPIVYRWPGGDSSQSEIVSRIDDYVCQGQTYYSPSMVIRTDDVDPAYKPSISSVLGVYKTPDLSGTNYFYAEDGTPGGYDPYYGLVYLGRELDGQPPVVWISYRHGGTYVGDPDRPEDYANDYTLDRWTGTFTFVRPQDPADVFKADYYFTTRSLTSPTDGGTIGPVGANTAPTLTSPLVDPIIGGKDDDFTYSVIYKDTDGPNGQAPTFGTGNDTGVRVVIDGVHIDMAPVTQGTPSYRAGVTYQYVTKLAAGYHDYYFVASDGLATATADADSDTLDIEAIDGPWLNDPPELTNGLVDPDPLGAVSAQDSVTYRVTYTDIDNDAPYAGTPKVYVDNPSETEYNGTVAARLTDPMEPTKYRSIRITGATFASGQLTGKLLQVTNGALIGRVYLIATNTSDTLKLMTDDLVADGFVVGNTFTIGVLQMHKVDTTQQNYVTGVTYEVTVPQLAVGEHRYHFKAASTLNPPVWLDPAPTMSEWARFPLSGELSGPTVAVLDDPLDPNHDPVLTPVDPIVTPTSGEPTDTYQFFVSYKDSDGDPPGYHDRLLGYVRVVFNDGSFSGDMTPMGTATYTTGRQFTLSSNSLPVGRHKFHFEASDGQAAVRWPALLAGLDPTANDPEVTVGGDTPPVVGETRVVATVDRTQPETSAPVIDMITSPIIATDGEASTLWGADRAALMQINIWDPVAQQYQTYEGGSLPSILAGTAMWILPDFTYPAEAVDPSSPPTMVSATDVLDYGKLYRLLKPVGTLYNQATDCPISLKRGWNQFGSPYLSSTTLGSATVTYGSQTVSLAQAERNGWIRGYAWMWDPAAAVINSANGYKLVHPTLSSASSRTIDPWRGYWIKSLVDCTLTLNAP